MTIVILISLPLILKSEQLNMKIIRVFYTLPNSILNYLQDITKINLEMRRDSHYPENRSRFQNSDEMWDEFLINNERKRKESVGGVQDPQIYKVICWKNFVAFYKNSFTKRLIIYCLISAAVSWCLQTYVGVIIPTLNLNSAAMIIKNSGCVGAFQAQVSTSLISELLSPLSEDVEADAQEFYSFLDNSTAFQYPTLENSFYETLNNTQYLQIYFRMLMDGNSTLGVNFNKMYALQISEFIDEFIPSSCPSYIDDCSYYGNIVSKGYFYSLHTSIFDSQYLAYTLYYNRNLSVPERVSLVQDDLLKLLKLQYHYINITSHQVKQSIISYFSNFVKTYNYAQELVLIFYYLFSVGYMIFIFRRTLKHHERKKKMTRSMLLLLPYRVVEFSKHIQRALKNMNYD